MCETHYSYKSLNISTHDLTRRSTPKPLPPLLLLTYFNSRPHKEVDTVPTSIPLHCLIFQLTTSQGGRLLLGTSLATLFIFQLTTSQGGRRLGKCNRLLHLHFNSRPHKEVDIYIVLIVQPLGISTHDLTRRSTAIFTQKVFLSKSLFVLIAYNTFILY